MALLGVEAIIAGDGVVCHKLGATGRRAIHFATNETAKDAMNELDLDMALIMFGTNEQQANQGPVSFGNALRNIISSLRNHNPDIDIVLMLPCYTKFELEQPRAHKLQEYGDVMRAVAVERAAAFMDFTEVFGPPQELQNLIDQGLMRHDRVHPSVGPDSGGWLIADTITKSILSVD